MSKNTAITLYDKLMNLIKEADTEFKRSVDADAFCEHEVGICSCSYWGMRERMKEALDNRITKSSGCVFYDLHLDCGKERCDVCN